MRGTSRYLGFIPVAAALVAGLLLIGCSGSGNGSGGGSGGPTISGSVTDSAGTHPIVGLFDGSTYTFFGGSTTPDPVTSESGGGSSPYSPLETAAVNGGSFSLSLPTGKSGAGYYLIAWDDSNGDGKLALSEHPYFATKSVPQGSQAITEISYVSVSGQGEYAVDYSTGGTSYIEGFSKVGTSGFNFTIP